MLMEHHLSKKTLQLTQLGVCHLPSVNYSLTPISAPIKRPLVDSLSIGPILGSFQ